MNEQEPQLPKQARAALEKSFTQIRLARASEMARSKQFLEAENLLSPDGKLPESSQELDLLARIAVHQRQYAKARHLWQVVLKNEPTNEEARLALANLGGPWIALALAKRLAIFAGIAILLSFSAVGLFALLSGFLRSEQSPTQKSSTPRSPVIASQQAPVVNEKSNASKALRDETTTERPKTQEQTSNFVDSLSNEHHTSVDAGHLQASLERVRQTQEEQTRLLSSEIQMAQTNQAILLENQVRAESRIVNISKSLEVVKADQLKTQQLLERAQNEIHALNDAYESRAQSMNNSLIASPRVVRLDFQINGVTITAQQTDSTIRFDAGLFDRDDHFRIGSKTLLESVAKALAQTQEKLRLQVIGFSEDEPPTWPWSKPRDRAALALARAERVKRYMDSLGFLPTNALTATAGSPEEQPFPGKPRFNRTVVLRVSRQ